jgi:hypothetical protein
VQRSEARDEATLRPRMRGRGTQPAINSVTISGPYNATAGGDSPSRRRIFVCTPSSAAQELPCARRILSTLARRAYRRPATETDVRDLLPFYERGRKEGSFDLGIQKALERLLVSSQFLFRIEREPSTVAAGAAYRVSDLSSASPRPSPPARRTASPISSSRRVCPSSSGAASRTMSCWTRRPRAG